MFKILLICLVISLSACTSQEDVDKYSELENWKDATKTGYRFFGCGTGDLWHTGFKAITQNDKAVAGVICSGLLKGATMRLD